MAAADADIAVTGGEGRALGAERHALDGTFLDEERSARQSLVRGGVPQHHAAASWIAVVKGVIVSGGEGLAVGTERQVVDEAFPHKERSPCPAKARGGVP